MSTLNFLLFVLVLLGGDQDITRRLVNGQQPLKNDFPFNVDLEFPITVGNQKNAIFNSQRSPEKQSLFGATLTAVGETIFVGAPKLKSKFDPKTITGAAFRCPVDFTRSSRIQCEEVDFLSSANDAREYVETNNSLVGFSMLAISNRNVLICAPTWVVNVNPVANDRDLSPEGTCFSVDPRRSGARPVPVFYSTEKRIEKSRPFESHALFGFSIANDEAGNSYVVGMPGFKDFTGTFAVRNGGVMARSVNFLGVNPDAYTGFSVHVITTREHRYLAVGAPRNGRFIGRVIIVNLSNNFKHQVYFLQSPINGTGDYFGSVLQVIRNRAQDIHHLLVGAPYHSTRNRRQIGRVYLYKNIVSSVLQNAADAPEIIQPKIRKRKALFGAAIAVIDLNKDGYRDVVISAPFEENEDEASLGAIYFFYNTHNGLNLNSEVRIEPKNFQNSHLRGFGFSLWTRTDLDRNRYNDIVVGSALSEEFTVLRTRPVIRLKVTMEFDRKGINMTDISQCKSSYACFRVTYCITTDARENFKQDVAFVANFTVSDRKLRLKENRALSRRQNVVLRSSQPKICSRNQQFYVEMKKRDDIYDIITPVEVELTVAVAEPKMKEFCAFCPVAFPVTAYREINFEHGCAGKNCVSDLHLSTIFKYGPEVVKDSLIQGTYSNFEMAILVKNSGEASIDTVMIIETSTQGLMLRSDETRCRVTQKANVFHCDVNRFLLKDQREEFKIHFDIDQIHSRELEFDLRLESKSDISKNSVVNIKKRINIKKQVNFNLLGETQRNFSFSTQSPEILFPISLLVDKTGPSRVNSTIISFLLPFDIVDIDHMSKYRCYYVDSTTLSLKERMLQNGTLMLPCDESPELCRRVECAVGGFRSGSQSQNFDLSLVFQSAEIPSKLAYEQVFFSVEFLLFTRDNLIPDNKPFATLRNEIIFEKQATPILPKTSPLIMIGGAGIGLIIILVAVFILIKAGFFKRKKREQMIRARARMSMSPAAFQALDGQLPPADQ